MHSLPKTSVIIPCFNGEKYIETAVRSVLDQDWQNLEIIVVDDGSTDGSALLIQNKFPQVILVQQANQGVAAARNTGIQNATSEWIAFLDADDVWLPKKLYLQWQKLQANPGVRMVYSAWQVWQTDDIFPSPSFLEHLESQSSKFDNWAGPSGSIYTDLLLDCVVWTSTVLMHKTVFDEVGKFDTSLRIGEDYDLWLRASRVTPILRVAFPLALYRIHASSITKTVPTKNYQGIVIERAIAQWGLVSYDLKRADKKAVYRNLSRTWSDFAQANLAKENYHQSWTASISAIKTQWHQLSGWKTLLKVVIYWFKFTRTTRAKSS
jgi:glycosyltransferase involved in cell wall biosynthesis